MKRNIFLALLFFIMPLSVYATNDVSIVCENTKLKINEETSCKLYASNLDFTVIDVSGAVKLGDNLQLISSSYDKNVWLSLDTNFSVTDINLMRHNNTNISGITIATFKVKATSNATGNSNISFNNILFGNSEYQSVSLNCNPVNIHFGNNMASLKNLSIKGYTLDFSSNKFDYSIDIEQSNIYIDAIATDVNAKISGIGNKSISYGKNVFEIIVTAENGMTKIYKINVNRKDTRSSVNDLTNITLSSGKINFEKNKTEYVVNVENKIDKIDLSYELLDKKSNAVIIGDLNLVEGENLLIIKVTAENEEVKEYKIKIIREHKIDITDSNKISNLIIKDHVILFDKDTYDYVISTDYKKLDITVSLVDDESIYEIIGNENLQDGSIITIKVIDKNDNVNTYKIIISNNTDNEKDSNSFWLIIVLCISFLYNVILTIIYFKKRK